MSAKPKLLVVDDEQVVCLSCRTIFSKQGFDVETTNSPREGLQLAADRKYAAILLDIMMPEMNGLEFLERLRTFNATVPVVIITGYASVTSAAEAMRLHASDYVPKPFTPDEITRAVRRVLSLSEETAASPAVGWAGADAGFVFLDHAWLWQGDDGTAVAGAFLAPDEGQQVESLRLAPVGSQVHAGLPLAEITLTGGRRLVVPSPADGEVLETNRAAADQPAAAWDDPCRTGWLARLRVDGSKSPAAPRRVLLACSDGERTELARRGLRRLGCEVQLARTAADVVPALRAGAAAVVVLDGASLDAAVPGLLGEIAALPRVRAVVSAPAGWRHDAAARRHKPFRLGAELLSGAPLIEALDAAFQSAPTAPPAGRTGMLPDTVRVVRITNRQGREVSLLAPDGVLHESFGVGQLLLHGLREAGVPMKVSLGAERLTSLDVWKLAQDCDRGFLLVSQDAGRIPGSLAREAMRSPWTPETVAEDKITTLVVQSAPTGAALAFDPRTTEALAQILLDRLLLTP